MTKKRGPKVKVTGSCFVYSSHTPIVCWLCGVTVPAGVHHACEKTTGGQS
jgi:hypothetical protein